MLPLKNQQEGPPWAAEKLSAVLWQWTHTFFIVLNILKHATHVKQSVSHVDSLNRDLSQMPE